MKSPLISVILPVFNRQHSLFIAAKSVLAQSHTHLELIIVDDASTVDLGATIERLGDPRIRYIRRPENGGPAAARNTGIAAAQGDWLAFQDSDDAWMLDKLELQVAAVTQAPRPALCLGSMLRNIDGGLRFFKPETNQQNDKGKVPHWILEQPIAYTQTWLVPRLSVQKLAGFDEALRMWEDWELLIRLSGELDLIAAPQALAYSARSEDSITNDPSLYAQSMSYVMQKHAPLYQHDKAASGRINYLIGLRELNAGHNQQALAHFMRAAHQRPTQWKAWLYILLGNLRLHKLTQALRAGMQNFRKQRGSNRL